MSFRSFLKIPVFVLLAGIFFQTSTAASDDLQYWSRYTLKTHTFDRWELSTYGEARFYEDASKEGLYQVSERLKVKASDLIDLGVNYTYINNLVQDSKRRTEEFKYQHRAELEVNPHWRAADWLKINTRNRFEFRWIEDRGSDNTRSRHLVEFEFPLEGRAPFQSIYANNEFFIDFNTEKHNENRAVPLGVKFKLSDKATLSVFYMIQARRGPADWSSNQILGTHLTVTF
jgi:hypothetical protein